MAPLRLGRVTTAISQTFGWLALEFYQKRGFTLCALDPGATSESRKRKPEIPERGRSGLPIRDEIELELRLSLPAGA